MEDDKVATAIVDLTEAIADVLNRTSFHGHSLEDEVGEICEQSVKIAGSLSRISGVLEIIADLLEKIADAR